MTATNGEGMKAKSIFCLMEIQVATVTLCSTTLFVKFQCAVTKPERNNVYGEGSESRSFPICPIPLRHKHWM